METTALFLSDRRQQTVMVLRGSAGTGKTTLAGAIVRAMVAMKQKFVLMAPTGRAAKVFSLYAGHPAFTIHRRIYRQRTAGLPSFSIPGSSPLTGTMAVFNLNDNLYHDTLFIIDEASMIANASTNETFGSGCLLDDLIRYVYSGSNCRMLLIGDKAQLPPVGEEEAPALMTDVLRGYGLIVYECDLNEVLRQSQQSGILFNATRIRQMITHDEMTQLPRICIKGFADICIVPGDELIESIASSYSHAGIEETIVITRSNKRANIYNQGIRRTVLDREEELCRGDQLMIVKNNYNVNPNTPLSPPERGKSSVAGRASTNPDLPPSGGLRGVFNGDRCVVQRVRNIHEVYGFRFADVTIQMPDYDDAELTTTVMLDTLTTEAPALTREQQEQLYIRVMEDYADIPQKTERIRRLKSDTYYNALQIKFAYAVTCHKAQGGQWAHVYLDQGYMTDDMLTPDYIHWLYTALTRATEKVFLVNWPRTQTES